MIPYDSCMWLIWRTHLKINNIGGSIKMDLIPIIFSTITGNAFKLAEAAAGVIPNHCGPYNIRYINDEVIERFDTFVLTYWCDKGSADPDTIALINRMKNKKLIIIGSLGVARDTKHYRDVCARVEVLASKENILVGHFLCQGAIDLCRTEKKLREGKITAEHFEKQKLSAGHPDKQDLEDAKEAVRAALGKL